MSPKMFCGLTTNEDYDKCISVGLCENHLKDLDEDMVKNEDRHELQRKAFSYIRLRILDPLVFGKPYLFEKMETLVSKSNYFAVNKNTSDTSEKQEKFIDSVLLLDSIVVFTLCQFCKICCSGCFFQSTQKPETDLNDEAEFIHKLLNSKNVSDSDLQHFNPILQDNFRKYDQGLIKVCYVIALLFVRNTTIKVRFKQALDELSTNLTINFKENAKWLEIAEEAQLRKENIESIGAYGTALTFNPYSCQGLSGRGLVYYYLEKYKQAHADAYISTIIDPYYWKSYFVLALCLWSEINCEDWANVLEFGIKNCRQDGSHGVNKLQKLLLTLKKKHKKYSNITSSRSDFEKMNGQSKTAIEDVPDLEASDSENELEDVPELSDDSDDEISKDLELILKNVKKEKKEEKLETKEKPTEFCRSNSVSENPVRKEELYKLLRDGTELLLNECGHLALQHFHDVLEILQAHSETCPFEEWEIVCIKYALGLANCSSGSHEDLLKSIQNFKEIIENHTKVTFPAAYYGIGLAYHKLNRFKDALKYLKFVKDMLEKKIYFKVYTWPGLKTVINETRVEQLKGLVDCKIKECESPPPPDAICRYSLCTSQPSIYYSDPDFKGFLTLQCSEHCSLNYHAQCWKTLKNCMHLTDKEFLEKKCLTPDCDGILTRVEITSKEGNSEKVFGSLPDKKPIKQKKLKTIKKTDSKEEKKRKQHSSRDSEEKVKESGENLQSSDMNNKATHESTLAAEFHANNCDTDICDKGMNENPPNRCSVSTEPFVIIKKEKICHEVPSKISSKIKELKKPKAVTLSIEEFCMKSDTVDNTYLNKTVLLSQKKQCSYKDEWPTCNETFGHSSLSYAVNEDNSENISQSVEQGFNSNDEDAIMSNLYHYLEDFLTRNGPLSITDSKLIRELEIFPTEANIVIAKYGGITEFLKNDPDYRFGIVDDTYVCSRHDLAIAYKLSRMSGVMAPDNANILDKYTYEDSKFVEPHNSLCLNPDAKEYRPLSLSSSESNSTTSFVSVPEELDSKMEKVIRNSPNLITAISKLRQPLAVDSNNQLLSKELFSYSESLAPQSADTFVEDKKDCNSIEHSTEECINALHLYISDKMVSQRSYIDLCIKPYKIMLIPEKDHKALQTELIRVETDSKSTMTTTDEEIDKLKEIIGKLNEEKSELEVQKTLLETKLSSEMDSATKHRKKSTVEIELLKKELEDSKLTLESQTAAFKNKEIKLEREYKLLRETLDHIKEESVLQKKEIDKLISDKSSLQDSLKEMKDENITIKNSFEELTKEHNNVKNMDLEETCKMTRRAKDAELQLLHFKKEVFLTTIDAKKVEAAQRIKELKENLPLVHPFYTKNIELLLMTIGNYVVKLAEIRNGIQNDLNEQINAVQNGIDLKTLKSVELKLPTIPSFAPTQYPVPNVPINNPPPVLNPALFSSFSGTQLQNPAYANPEQNPMHIQHIVPQNQLVPNVFSGQSSGIVSQSQKPPPGIAARSNYSESSSLKTNSQAIKDKAETLVLTPADPAASSNLSAISKSSLPVSSTQCVNTEGSGAKDTMCDIKKQGSTGAETGLDAISKNSAAPNISAAAALFEVEEVCDKPSLELGYKVKNTLEKTSSTLSLQSIASNGKSNENSCVKLLRKLKSKYPQIDEAKLMACIKEFRTKRKNTLSGLAVEKIVSGVSALIDAQQSIKTETHAKYQLPSKGLVNKKLVPDKKEVMPTPPPAQKVCPWGSNQGDSKNQWDGSRLEEDCIICYESMNFSNAYKVDCGHCFHLTCIKEWLRKKSDCPICRVHLLLPEDYPALS